MISPENDQWWMLHINAGLDPDGGCWFGALVPELLTHEIFHIFVSLGSHVREHGNHFCNPKSHNFLLVLEKLMIDHGILGFSHGRLEPTCRRSSFLLGSVQRVWLKPHIFILCSVQQSSRSRHVSRKLS